MFLRREENQIKIRANRIKHSNKECLIYSENKLENIFAQAEKIKPNILIIDSIRFNYKNC